MPDARQGNTHPQVALLGAAWATDEELTLYFVATRCDLSWPFFCVCWTLALVVKLPCRASRN